MAIPFTAKALKEHPKPAPGERPIVCSVQGHANKKITFTATGITLGYDRSHDCIRHKGTIGHFPDMPLPVYDRLFREKMLEIETGQNLSGQDLTVNEIIDLHVLPEVEGRNRDIKGFKRRLKRIRAKFGKRKISSLTTHEISLFLDFIAKTCKNSTVNRYHSALSRIFSTAVRLNICRDNPCKKILRRPEPPARKRILSSDELYHLIDEALRMDTFHALALLVSLFASWRIGDVLRITRDMLNADFTVIELADTKNGETYYVRLNGPTRQLLMLCAERSWNQFLFPSAIKDGRPIAHPTETYQRLRKYVAEKTGITKHWYIHDLRRTHASLQLKQTGDIRLVQQTLFHSSAAVTERYCYHEDGQLAAASEATAQALLGHHALTFQQQETNDAR